jgi:hypothetical protein
VSPPPAWIFSAFSCLSSCRFLCNFTGVWFDVDWVDPFWQRSWIMYVISVMGWSTRKNKTDVVVITVEIIASIWPASSTATWPGVGAGFEKPGPATLSPLVPLAFEPCS